MPRAPSAASSRLAGTATSVSGRASRSAAARPSALARSRSTSRMRSAPSAASPNAIARPTPPAPTWQTGAGPRGAEGRAPGRDEAGVVGIEPPRAARPEQHRVDRPHRPDHRLVDPDPRRRALLVRVGDVDPLVASGRAAVEQLVESGSLLGRYQQVVGDLDAPHPGRERVQPRGAGCGDVVADESEPNLLHEPSLPGNLYAGQDSLIACKAQVGTAAFPGSRASLPAWATGVLRPSAGWKPALPGGTRPREAAGPG